MITSTARFATKHGSKYISQLCKHFAHKVEVEYDDTHGRAALPSGPAELVADAEGLNVRVTAPDLKGIIGARFVIDSHLVTFAYREDFSGFQWNIEPGSTVEPEA